MCSQPPAERVRVNVVGEDPLAVELDDRERLAVAGLELRVARDVDLLELEAELGAKLLELPARPLAEVAALCVVERDYG
ncbi:MAG TPA: hypothetical protein VMT59_05570 [Gaiellaceae bacterium]|nr:hypothetical protein [Gaiellaceae bacterium]